MCFIYEYVPQGPIFALVPIHPFSKGVSWIIYVTHNLADFRQRFADEYKKMN